MRYELELVLLEKQRLINEISLHEVDNNSLVEESISSLIKSALFRTSNHQTKNQCCVPCC